MFQRMAIKNFRVFRELNVEQLGPINLFTGRMPAWALALA